MQQKTRKTAITDLFCAKIEHSGFRKYWEYLENVMRVWCSMVIGFQEK